jgi:hypothetical protein
MARMITGGSSTPALEGGPRGHRSGVLNGDRGQSSWQAFLMAIRRASRRPTNIDSTTPSPWGARKPSVPSASNEFAATSERTPPRATAGLFASQSAESGHEIFPIDLLRK